MRGDKRAQSGSAVWVYARRNVCRTVNQWEMNEYEKIYCSFVGSDEAYDKIKSVNYSMLCMKMELKWFSGF